MKQFPIGQGHGVAGRFCGLPDQFSDFNQSKIAILPVAFDKTTTYRHGTEKGPAALIEASRNVELYDIETQTEVYLHGICTLPILKPKNSNSMLHSVYEISQDLIQQDKFMVTLGGEHSISFAPIKAHSELFPSLSILQLDAHADLQDAYENNPWSHASVMARVIELPKIKSIVAVGVRSMSQEELKHLSHVKTFFCHELFNSDEWMTEVVRHLSKNVYITLDLDVFDSGLMPSTGTPEPGGLDWPRVTKLLKLVSQQRNLVGFDVVELCPQAANPAPDFLAAKLVYKLLSYKFFSQ